MLQTKEAFVEHFNKARGMGFDPYIQVNGYIEEQELVDLRVWLKDLIQLNPKGFYFNDFAVQRYLKQKDYRGELIYAPETILTNALDIELILTQVDRVYLSKELTLEEMMDLCKLFPNKIEAFGLGYPLMSFSRRPLVRSYLAEIEYEADVLNRLDMTIKEAKRTQHFPILEEKEGTSIFIDAIHYPKEELHLLSDDLCYGVHLDDLLIEEDSFVNLNQALFDEAKSLELIRLDHSNHKLGQAYYYRKTNMSKEEGQ
jgi:collagenase-like PrtC family protease